MVMVQTCLTVFLTVGLITMLFNAYDNSVPVWFIILTIPLFTLAYFVVWCLI